MKIILENEMEKDLWNVILAAHRKWEKNHGDTIRYQMERYFWDLWKEEVQAVMAREVEFRLHERYEGILFDNSKWLLTEREYVQISLSNYPDDEIQEFKKDIADEYQEILLDYQDDKEILAEKIKDEVTSFYYNLFNAPEYLAVEYNGQIIQAQDVVKR